MWKKKHLSPREMSGVEGRRPRGKRRKAVDGAKRLRPGPICQENTKCRRERRRARWWRGAAGPVR